MRVSNCFVVPCRGGKDGSAGSPQYTEKLFSTGDGISYGK